MAPDSPATGAQIQWRVDQLEQRMGRLEANDQVRTEILARMDERGVSLSVEGRTAREKAASLVNSGRSLEAITAALDMYPGDGSPFKLDGARGTDRSKSRLTDTILEMGN